jgi:hypothetical protein
VILALAAALLAQMLPATDVATAARVQGAQAGDQSAAAAAMTDAPAVTQTSLAVTDKNHPDFVRCRSSLVIGSLAKRTKTCMTNKQWEEVAHTGNRGARDIVESQRVGMNGQ